MKIRSTRHFQQDKYPYLAIPKCEESNVEPFHPSFRPGVVLFTSPHTGIVLSPGSLHHVGEVGNTINDERDFVKYNGTVTLSN